MSLLLIATAALMMQSAPASAEALWQNLRIGSSEADITRAYPEAKFDQYASKPGNRKLRLEGFPSQGMWVYFTVTGDGLKQVDLHGRGRADFMNVMSALGDKYGPATKESQLGGDHTSIWAKGRVTITATYDDKLSLGAGFSANEHFTVTYQSASNRDIKSGL